MFDIVASHRFSLIYFKKQKKSMNHLKQSIALQLLEMQSTKQKAKELNCIVQ